MQNLLGFKGHPAPAPPHPGVAGSPWTGGRRGGQGWAGRPRIPGSGRPGEESARSHSRDTEEVAPASPASTAEGPPGSRRRARGRGSGGACQRQVRGADYKSQHAPLP